MIKAEKLSKEVAECQIQIKLAADLTRKDIFKIGRETGSLVRFDPNSEQISLLIEKGGTVDFAYYQNFQNLLAISLKDDEKETSLGGSAVVIEKNRVSFLSFADESNRVNVVTISKEGSQMTQENLQDLDGISKAGCEFLAGHLYGCFLRIKAVSGRYPFF